LNFCPSIKKIKFTFSKENGLMLWRPEEEEVFPNKIRSYWGTEDELEETSKKTGLTP
jgi:hypothetical protein